MKKIDIKLNLSTKIILIVFTAFLIIYCLLFLNAKKIEAEVTFVGKNVKQEDVINFCPEIGLVYEEINIDDGEGNNINGLFMEGTNGKTVYYFHGNGGPINCFYDDLKYINNLGYNIIAYDYPGYGKSGGYPYTEVVNNFSDKFFQYIRKEKGIKNEDLVLWGFSIGTAEAADFASKNNYDKLLLFAPFSSKYDLVESYVGIALQKFLFLKNSYITKNVVKNFDRPLLIIHGNKDNIIPFEQGRDIYKNALGEKYFIELDGESHNYIIQNFGESLVNIIKDFIDGEDLNFESGYLFLNDNAKNNLEFENRNDLYTDSSVQKFVTSNLSFSDLEYYPSDLVSISGEYIHDTKGGSQTLRKEAKEALDKLGKAFYESFGRNLNIVSAFRSYNYQRGIKANGCPDNYCAKAGYSEHQTGLVVDIFEASSNESWNKNPTLMKYYMWLVQNAHLYGFHNTYQKGLEIDGYEIEPWHWRYLGVELATYLHENKVTIAEYYNEKNNKTAIVKW